MENKVYTLGWKQKFNGEEHGSYVKGSEPFDTQDCNILIQEAEKYLKNLGGSIDETFKFMAHVYEESDIEVPFNPTGKFDPLEQRPPMVISV